LTARVESAPPKLLLVPDWLPLNFFEPDPLEFWVAEVTFADLVRVPSAVCCPVTRKAQKRAKRRYDAAVMKQVPK
jgi:hypothetical protein